MVTHTYVNRGDFLNKPINVLIHVRHPEPGRLRMQVHSDTKLRAELLITSNNK